MFATRAAGADDAGAEIERRRDADRLHRDVDARAAGDLHDLGLGVLAADHGVGGAEARLACLSRDSAVSTAMIRPAPAIAAVIIAASPTGPAPTTAIVSPGRDAAVLDADLVARREDVGEEEDLLVADALGHEVHRRLGERDARVLGLHAVDQVAEDPADPADGLAVGGHPGLARPAAPARGDRGHEHPVALLQRRDRGAGLDHRADRFMAEDAALGHRGHVALEDVQVGAADRRRLDLDDHVGRVLDARIVDVVPGPLPRTAEYECLHVSPFGR